MPDDKVPWLGTILKYLVLPAGIILALYWVVTSIFQGNQALTVIQNYLGGLMKDYNDEEDEFLANDGIIDANETAVLQTKLQMIDNAQQSIANAIFDPTKVAIILGTVTVGAIFVWKMLKGGFGPLLSRFTNSVTDNNGRVPVPPAGAYVSAFETPETARMFMTLSSAMKFADAGNTALASSMIQAAQANYFTQTLPQMQASSAYWASLLPTLTGVQLAFAQYMITQYTIYLTYFTATLPIWFTMLPPI